MHSAINPDTASMMIYQVAGSTVGQLLRGVEIATSLGDRGIVANILNSLTTLLQRLRSVDERWATGNSVFEKSFHIAIREWIEKSIWRTPWIRHRDHPVIKGERDDPFCGTASQHMPFHYQNACRGMSADECVSMLAEGISCFTSAVNHEQGIAIINFCQESRHEGAEVTSDEPDSPPSSPDFSR